MSDDNRTFSREIQYALFAAAGLSALAAIGHAIVPERIDQETAMFLALAIIAVTFSRVTKFKGFGIELEKEVEEIRRGLQSVENNVGALEKEVGPGSKSAAAPSPVPSPPAAAESARAHVEPYDPHKGNFGGQPEVNGRKLSANITPLAGRSSSRCRVSIRVESTDANRPLEGPVMLYLHPTFGRWAQYAVDTKDGVAEGDIISYGAFTIGAITSDGTKLELDLIDVPGGTRRFYEE
ncbi:MAG TPA: hypothetical protein VMM79_14770 [Longimicrobiales bacterium]|nr:hypothetical protein [Longimicrobiales bacterium]